MQRGGGGAKIGSGKLDRDTGLAHQFSVGLLPCSPEDPGLMGHGISRLILTSVSSRSLPSKQPCICSSRVIDSSDAASKNGSDSAAPCQDCGRQS